MDPLSPCTPPVHSPPPAAARRTAGRFLASKWLTATIFGTGSTRALVGNSGLASCPSILPRTALCPHRSTSYPIPSTPAASLCRERLIRDFPPADPLSQPFQP